MRGGREPWGEVLGQGAAWQARTGPHCRPGEHSHLQTPRYQNFQQLHCAARETGPGQGRKPPELPLLPHQLTLSSVLHAFPIGHTAPRLQPASDGPAGSPWNCHLPSPGLSLSLSPKSGRGGPLAHSNTVGYVLSWLGLPLPHTSRLASPNTILDPQNHRHADACLPILSPAETCATTLWVGPTVAPMSQRKELRPRVGQVEMLGVMAYQAGWGPSALASRGRGAGL